MADPYRRKPEDPPAEPVARRADRATLGFGLLCAVLGEALTGQDRLKSMLIATVFGTLLLLLRREPRS